MTRLIKIFFVSALFVASSYHLTAQADVFGYADEDGALYLADTAIDEQYALLAVAPVEPITPLAIPSPRGIDNVGFASLTPTRSNAPYYDAIKAAAASSGVDGRLLHAVITTESNYNPRAVSPKGAAGLMQLMPKTARQYGVSNVFDPTQNIQGGARYLAYLLRLFNDDIVLSVAAYNAGENSVIQHGRKVPPFRETVAYVSKVINLYKRYE